MTKVRKLLVGAPVTHGDLGISYTVKKAGAPEEMLFVPMYGDKNELTAAEVANREQMEVEEFLDLEVKGSKKVRDLSVDTEIDHDGLGEWYTVKITGTPEEMRFVIKDGDGTELTAADVAAKEEMGTDEFLDLLVPYEEEPTEGGEKKPE